MTTVHRPAMWKVALLIGTLALLAIGGQAANVQASSASSRENVSMPVSEWAALTAQIQQTGTAKVIVALKSAVYDALTASASASHPLSRESLRTAQPIAQQARVGLLSALAGYHTTVYAGSNWLIPAVALTVDQSALDYLKTSPLVAGLSTDHVLHVEDAASDSQVGANAMWGAIGGGVRTGYTGTGGFIAVLDTGVQKNHPFFTTDGTSATSRFVANDEACYSGDGVQSASLCPNGNVEDLTPGSGNNCALTISMDCQHGTHVAGIAAGNGLYAGGVGYAGVAPTANIMPIQVFSKYQTGIAAYDSDVISGLGFVEAQFINYGTLIPSVVLSVGLTGIHYPGQCDQFNAGMTQAIQALYSSNIAVVVPNGDDGSATGNTYPSCIDYTFSVGAVTSSDAIASFSDQGPQTTLYAPGFLINSALPYTSGPPQYGALSGTSMAAAHVAGAIALIRQEMNGSQIISYSDITTDKLKFLLVNTGRLLPSGVSRLQIDAAGYAALPRPKTIGVYRNNAYFIRNSNSTGVADAVIAFSSGQDAYPIVGDWSASKYDQIGIYQRNTGVFIVCEPPFGNTNADCATAPDSWLHRFVLGNPLDFPLAGRWYLRSTYDISGPNPVLISYPPTGAGVYRPSNGLLYMRNTLTTGYSDFAEVLGNPGDIGIAGGWSRNGQDSPGVYRPSISTMYLSNTVTNGIVNSDEAFAYGNGSAGDQPVVGNWLGGPNTVPYNTGVGVYRSSTGFFLLRDTLDSGPSENGPTGAFFYGNPSDVPVVGDWSPSSSFFNPPPANRINLPPALLVTPSRVPNIPGVSAPGGNSIGG